MQTAINSRKFSFTILFNGLLFLVFFQLLSDFVETIYAFGLMGTNIPVEIAFVLLFFSPLVLLFLPRGIRGWPLILIGELVFLCRGVETLLDTRGKMIVAGLGVALFLLFFPCYFLQRQKENQYHTNRGFTTSLGLALGLIFSIFFRTMGSGFDFSTYGWAQVIGWIYVLIAGILLILLQDSKPTTIKVEGEIKAPIEQALSVWRVIVYSLGVFSIFTLCYFAFSSPHVIARWTGVSHLIVVSGVAIVLFLFFIVAVIRPHLLVNIKTVGLLLWNLLFVTSLTLTILVHQIHFPSQISDYPFFAPVLSWFHHIPLFFMILLCPVILVDAMRLIDGLASKRPSARSLGVGFSIASLYFFLIIFAQAFTTVYDYIPVVGPFFRDKFWLVFLIPGLVLTASVLLIKNGAYSIEKKKTGRTTLLVLTAVLVLTTVIGVFLTASNPTPHSSSKTSLKIMAYNIQQGYDKMGQKGFTQQLELFREIDADIIGLEESDTARIAGGNADIVKYYADQLDMYSYYGPETVTGTFGIALLSKYPLINPQTFYMYSSGEQTATIEAQISVGGKIFTIFVTHLGNGGPIFQQENVMKVVQNKENVILMGDFNFRPDTDSYHITTDILKDSWLLKWPFGNESQGIDPARRIDYIFMSPSSNIHIVDSTYLPGTQSDHPALVTQIEW